MTRRAWIVTGVIVAAAGGVAAALYSVFDAGTATFFLIAGLIVCVCASGTVLLAAYTRAREEREYEDEE